MPESIRPDRSSSRWLCSLLAVLTACGPATTVLAQEVQRPVPPRSVTQPAPNPQRTTDDTTLLGNKAMAPASEIDLSYALSDAAVILVARPGQVLNSAMMEMMPTEVIQAASIKETGLDPLKVDQIVLSVSPPANGPPNYTALVRFAEAATLDSEQLTRHTQPGEVNGKDYLKSQDFMAPSILQPDEKSFLLTPDFSMQELTKPDRINGVGPLAAKVAAATRGDDFFLMVDVAAIRPLLQMGMQQVDLPPELDDLRELPDLISTVEFRVNFSNQSLTNLVVTANDEAAADKLMHIVESKKALVRAKAQPEIQKALASDDPVEQASGRYGTRMLKRMDESVQFDRDGVRLTLFQHDPKVDGSGGLLTNYATIGVLVGLLLPAVQAAREAARRNMSMNNMKQIMLAMHNYHDTMGQFPAHASYDDEGNPLLSWRVHILPFIEEQALYEQFHLDEPWDSEHNKTLIEKMPDVYAEPSAAVDPRDGNTHYLAPVGGSLAFDGTSNGIALRKFTDGLSNTIALLQVDNTAAVTWTKPADWELNAKKPLAGLDQAIHPAIFLAGLADGSVHSMSFAIDPEMFKALLTRNGGEVVNW
ncbi:DUF1559 domain-containing protein [Adhaeretor mobilis]|uniref:DUF1559 domain-containing protein n=1 Tax=Adhaeretor mobilis TaxID=1930276 RepID=A0A517MY30_9BACT|nr:DUF1559 domain-containing protein [Adhaeretor mobilis]QDS99790.1 hypothetical protein HG15A2_31210 [Adhaeretor mobilis]